MYYFIYFSKDMAVNVKTKQQTQFFFQLSLSCTIWSKILTDKFTKKK